ncbi:hypothetical protein KCM76_01635 [Zooshikella marina]|uniref:hypothetical protein n=1 Tax=Zooshikella ganghwensis TaxID=202772 RepID=UPI0004262F3F|nr:hypothetical protein [Zooshikella ganghwensis]MBU2704664.1 hypothetical protein [Zooshikella ganghwensis]
MPTRTKRASFADHIACHRFGKRSAKNNQNSTATLLKSKFTTKIDIEHDSNANFVRGYN